MAKTRSNELKVEQFSLLTYVLHITIKRRLVLIYLNSVGLHFKLNPVILFRHENWDRFQKQFKDKVCLSKCSRIKIQLGSVSFFQKPLPKCSSYVAQNFH